MGQPQRAIFKDRKSHIALPRPRCGRGTQENICIFKVACLLTLDVIAEINVIILPSLFEFGMNRHPIQLVVRLRAARGLINALAAAQAQEVAQPGLRAAQALALEELGVLLPVIVIIYASP